MKIGRNEPCHCGSGLKFKKCHGAFAPAGEAARAAESRRQLERIRASELIREQQQGRGRPIVAGDLGEHKFVAVRNRIYWSKKWKTFPDFLSDYMKRVLDPAWGNAEIAKPLEQRHVVMQWYDDFCHYQRELQRDEHGLFSGETIGVVACYLGLAYALYLLDHNVELQTRLVARLKNPENFQGAYYELVVASALIRAGFELTLEDEADRASQHCEYAAVSKRSGKRYWVEAKMKSVAGLLGKTAVDGSPDPNPTSHLVHHLSRALAKPAADGRLIFVDLNAPIPIDAGPDSPPDFIANATHLLERFERKQLQEGTTAYVFVTSVPFHQALRSSANLVVVPFGLGHPDFNRPGVYRLSDRWRQDRKHRDVLDIAEAFSKYLALPSTFNGELPSEALGRSNRIMIGETYFFEGDVGGLATVTSASVVESEKAAYIGTSDGRILKQPLTDADLADYRKHPEAYFGQILPVGRRCNNLYELFEFFMDSYAQLPREKMLERFAAAPNLEQLQAMNDDELRAEFCEAMAGASGMFKSNRAAPSDTRPSL